MELFSKKMVGEKMAKIETANLITGKVKHANISDVVGVGGKNERNDLMLIQAMFRILGGVNHLIKKQIFGFEKDKDLPEITGNLDGLTIETIWSFQRYNASNLLNLDGKIHPARYANRLISAPVSGRVMMITRLNVEAEFSITFLRHNNDIALAIKSVAPFLVFD